MAFDIVKFYHDIVLNRIVTAAIIFFVGFMLGRIAGNFAKRILFEIGINKRLSKFFHFRINIEKWIPVLLSYAIYLGTIIMALNRLAITDFVLKGIIFFFLAIIFSSLILDLRDLVPNLYSWLKIKKNRYFKENDRIKTPLAEGVVKRVTPFTTRIITDHGDELYIQNSAVLENLSVKKAKLT